MAKGERDMGKWKGEKERGKKERANGEIQLRPGIGLQFYIQGRRRPVLCSRRLHRDPGPATSDPFGTHPQ